MDRKPNPSNSSCIQMLLDMKSAAMSMNDDEGIKLANDCLDHLMISENLRMRTDALYNTHRHPKEKMNFVKKYNAVANPESSINAGFSINAKFLLDYMCERMTVYNIFALNQKAVMKNTGLTRPAFTKAVSELISKGFIRVRKKHSKVNPTVYDIISDYAKYGEFDNRELFAVERNEEGQPFCLADMYKGVDTSVSSSYYVEGDKKIYYHYNDIVSESG